MMTKYFKLTPLCAACALIANAAIAKQGQESVWIEPTDGNSTPAVVAAVQRLEDGGTIRFKKGEYHFYEEGAHVKSVKTRATVWGEKKLVFDFEGKNGITVDGGGSTFVWHGNVFPFAFSKCRNVTVGNFTARAFHPSYVELRIEKYEEDGSFVFRFNEGVAYRVKDGALLIETDLGLFDSREKIISVHALERVAIYYLFAANEKTARDRLPSSFLNGLATDLGGGRIRICNRRQDLKGCLAKFPYKVGEPLCFLLNGRERCSLLVNECRDVRIHDVWLQNGDGMGIVSFLNENVTIDGYRVEPRAGERVSISADCLFVINNRGKIDVRNSTFSWALDDAINMHGNYLRVESVKGNVLELEPIHVSYYNFPPYHPGDTVEFTDPVSHDVLQTAKVVSAELRPHHARLTLDADASKLAKGTLVEDLTWLPDVSIRDCVFHDVMHLRLSGRGRYLVEDNVFRRGIGILISDLSAYWGEAGRTGDMTIRNNEFDRFSSRGWNTPFIVCEVEGRGARIPKIHRGIRVEGNRVKGLPKNVPFTRLTCALDPIVRNNTILDAPIQPASVTVDATKPGRVMPNTSQVLTFWNGVRNPNGTPRNWKADASTQKAYPIREFVRYAELMACTGGNKSRDLFKDPDDRTKLDDYDFEPLIAACRGIRALGIRPYLKLGNVPAKFTVDYDGGEFSMNIHPPTDDLVHYRYMKACAAALKAEFGRDEVRSWRFAVLTEADNTGWFQTKSKSKDELREAFFRLYDYTAKAFEEELGPGLVFGTHLLYPNCRQSQFSVEEFVEHCAKGRNAATGQIGSPLRLLTASYYGKPDCDDLTQGRCADLRRLRAAVDKFGFKDVVMGVDEGRVIVARAGREKSDLLSRAVGASYQAAFDVRVMKEIFDDRMDYFASWGYFTGPTIHFQGVPSHHFFSCRELARFEGLRRVPATVTGKMPAHEELDVLAGVAEKGDRLRVVVGRFRDKLVFTNRFATAVSFVLPKAWAGKTAHVGVLTLDDRNNWYCDWERDRKKLDITAKDYDWSPDDFAVLADLNLKNPRYRAHFSKHLQPVYAARAATVKPVSSTARIGADASLTIPLDFVGNGAAYVYLCL